jgi:hypothetical protein
VSKGVVESCSMLGGISRMWGGWNGEEEEGEMRRKSRLERRGRSLIYILAIVTVLAERS